MTAPFNEAEDAALWRRWRASGLQPGEPDALTLAAYAEGRLPSEEAEAVEDWLAAQAQLAEDVLAARRVRDAALPEASDAVLARAMALAGDGAVVLAFRRPAARPHRWRSAAGWSAIAASLLVASLAGFAMGHDTYLTLAGGGSAALSQELIDPPIGLFNGLDEDSST
jgi:anti-sigma factor RsiW